MKAKHILAIAALLAVLPVGAAQAENPPAHKHHFLRGWDVLNRTKDGAVAIRYQLPDPFSNVWQWQFRSTYKKPVHVDFTVTGFSIRRNGRAQRTVFIPAHGTTELLGFPSRLQPDVTIDQVRE